MAKHLTQEQRYYICLHLSRNSRNIGDYDSDYAGKKATLIRTNASKAKAFSKLTPRMDKYIRDKLNCIINNNYR